MSSGFLYAGNSRCGTPGRWRKFGRGEVTMNIVVRFGMISASLARAGSSVGGASRCRSIPSNTRTNLRRPLL